jgi:hypothetical protein
VDDPTRRSHCPRARRLPRVNSATGLQLTAPCSLLSLIRLSFRPRERRTVHRRTDFVVGFPPCGRPRARHSGDQRFGSVAASDSGSISFVSYPPLQVSNNSYLVARRVGAHLTVGPPPGTVRAPLDAYGSTSDTAEGHIFQRGLFSVLPESGLQVGFRPRESQTQVVPVIASTSLSRNNRMEREV